MPKFLRKSVSLHGFKVIDFEAERVNRSLFKWWDCKISWLFRGIGLVIDINDHRVRRMHIKHEDLAHNFPKNEPIGMHAIEVLDE